MVNPSPIHANLQETQPEGLTRMRKAADTLMSVQFSNTLGLVSLADRKAQMMLGTNSIVLSIVFSLLSRRTPDQSFTLLIPAVILAITSVATTFLSIMVVRPKIIKLKSKKNATRQHQLMSEVIFSKMTYEDFRDRMQMLVADDEKIFQNLVEGLYANGQVLERKFRYLNIVYKTFTVGMVLALVSFVTVFTL